VTNHEGEVAPGRRSYWLVKLQPAAREKLVEEGSINAEHHGRRAHRPARASGNCLGGSGIMSFSERSQIAADIRKRRLCQHPARCCREYAVRVQQVARQVEPVSPRILGAITKYVGELQRPAEFCCNPLAYGRLLAEDA
jgi:hypothetical protein